MGLPSFEEKLAQHDLDLSPLGVDTLQVNVTRLCNQACHEFLVAAFDPDDQPLPPATRHNWSNRRSRFICDVWLFFIAQSQ
jgi:hypothetical protein